MTTTAIRIVTPCPVPTCPDVRGPGQAMCRACWALVPPELRAGVALTWHPEEESREYLFALKRATDWVAEQRSGHDGA